MEGDDLNCYSSDEAYSPRTETVSFVVPKGQHLTLFGKKQVKSRSLNPVPAPGGNRASSAIPLRRPISTGTDDVIRFPHAEVCQYEVLMLASFAVTP